MEAQRFLLNERDDYRKKVTSDYSREINLAFQAKRDGRDDEFESHLRRATTLASVSTLNPQEKARMISQALKSAGKDMIDSVAQKFMRTSPEALDAYIRRLEGKDKQ